VATSLIAFSEGWNSPTRAASDGWGGQFVVQPFVPGKPASVALLVGAGRVFSLQPAEQILSADGTFHYLGGRSPLPAAEERRARRLGERAAATVPGLRGFVGLDIVLGEDPDGSGDAVIEINPRLTTSYAGLREVARFNLAAALLAVTENGEPPAFEWRPGPVRWRADGRIEPG
jgi:predicted ATP-grasp superfamily ATP-dependent carboligase